MWLNGEVCMLVGGSWAGRDGWLDGLADGWMRERMKG